jgi:hypothetical protein
VIQHTFNITRSGADLGKQGPFIIASSLTRTAQEIKTAQVKATDDAFTIRTNWNKQGPLAFKVQAATKQNPVAVIGTAADFLEKFVREAPGRIVIKLPRGEFIAVPTGNVRRTKRDIIRAAQRPGRLRGKRDIVLPMRSGRGMVLFQEQGRGHNAKRVALYFLVPRAKIKEVDVIAGPAQKVFTKRYPIIHAEQTAKALATAR